MNTVEYWELALETGNVAPKLTEAAREGWRFVAWVNEWRDPYGAGRCREALLSRPITIEEPKKKHR